GESARSMLKEAITSVKRCVAPAGSGKRITGSSGAVGSESMTMTSRPRVLIRSTSVRHCTEPAPKTLPTTGTITVALGASGSSGGACAAATAAARRAATMSTNRGMSFLRRRLPSRVSNKARPENPPQHHIDLFEPGKRESSSQDEQGIAAQAGQHGGVDAAHQKNRKARVRGELAEERLGGAEVRLGAIDLERDELPH